MKFSKKILTLFLLGVASSSSSDSSDSSDSTEEAKTWDAAQTVYPNEIFNDTFFTSLERLQELTDVSTENGKYKVWLLPNSPQDNRYFAFLEEEVDDLYKRNLKPENPYNRQKMPSKRKLKRGRLASEKFLQEQKLKNPELLNQLKRLDNEFDCLLDLIDNLKADMGSAKNEEDKKTFLDKLISVYQQVIDIFEKKLDIIKANGGNFTAEEKERVEKYKNIWCQKLEKLRNNPNSKFF